MIINLPSLTQHTQPLLSNHLEDDAMTAPFIGYVETTVTHHSFQRIVMKA